MTYEAFVGDVGTVIERTIYGGPDAQGEEVADLSLATVSLIVIRPDGSKFTAPMEFVTDGADGLVEYKVKPGDDLWTVPGVYRSQCIVRWSADDDYATHEVSWRVGPRREI